MRVTVRIEDFPVSPKLVDEMRVSSQGVWHPDALGLSMGWLGGGFGLDTSPCYFNPFNPVARHRRRLTPPQQRGKLVGQAHVVARGIRGLHLWAG